MTLEYFHCTMGKISVSMRYPYKTVRYFTIRRLCSCRSKLKSYLWTRHHHSREISTQFSFLFFFFCFVLIRYTCKSFETTTRIEWIFFTRLLIFHIVYDVVVHHFPVCPDKYFSGVQFTRDKSLIYNACTRGQFLERMRLRDIMCIIMSIKKKWVPITCNTITTFQYYYYVL